MNSRWLDTMEIPVVEFSRVRYKIRKLILSQKTFLILYPSLENSTAGIAIFDTNILSYISTKLNVWTETKPYKKSYKKLYAMLK